MNRNVLSTLVHSFTRKKHAVRPAPKPEKPVAHSHLGRAILEEILPLHSERLIFYSKYAELVLTAEGRSTPSVVRTVFSYILTKQEYEDLEEWSFDPISDFLNTL